MLEVPTVSFHTGSESNMPLLDCCIDDVLTEQAGVLVQAEQHVERVDRVAAHLPLEAGEQRLDRVTGDHPGDEEVDGDRGPDREEVEGHALKEVPHDFTSAVS